MDKIGWLGIVAADTDVVPAANAQQATAGGDDSAELAKKLSNPIASLISVPFKLDWDTGIGPAGADRSMFVVQPVIPFTLGENWNLISRTIVPVISAQSPAAGGHSESGLGDITQSFFFSPKAPTSSGWIWGAGPVLLLPSASINAVGSEKWGAGPTGVFLKQDRGLTYGLLANHIWSFAGTAGRANVSATFLQSFLSHTTKTYTTYSRKHRVHLRLAEQAMDGADQFFREPVDEVRQTTGQLRIRCALLRRAPGGRFGLGVCASR